MPHAQVATAAEEAPLARVAMAAAKMMPHVQAATAAAKMPLVLAATVAAEAKSTTPSWPGK